MLTKFVRRQFACRINLYSTNSDSVNRSTPITYDEAKEKRKMASRFGLNGLKAGIDIRKLWPTVEEIREINDLKLHSTAQEAMRLAEQQKQTEIQRHINKQRDIDEKLSAQEL